MQKISIINSDLNAPSSNPVDESFEHIAEHFKEKMHPLMFAIAEGLHSQSKAFAYDEQRKTLLTRFYNFDVDAMAGNVQMEIAIEQKGQSLSVKLITTIGSGQLDELGEDFEDLLLRESAYFCRARKSFEEYGREILPKGGKLKYQYEAFMANVYVVSTEVLVSKYMPDFDQQAMVDTILLRAGLMERFWNSCFHQHFRDQFFMEKLQNPGILALANEHGLGFNLDYQFLSDFQKELARGCAAQEMALHG